jgi:VanZ family protein
MPGVRRATVPLAAVAAALIVYASLYPLTGWDHPAGWSAWREIRLPWPSRWTESDAWLNVLGYLPFGLLMHLALARAAVWRPAAAAAGAVVAAAALSLSMESLQTFLPQRVPSSLDLAWNVAGAAAGVALGMAVQALRWLDHGASLHDRWFEPPAAGGTTLLLLWPVGLLIPTPVALGLGPEWGALAAQAAGWLDGSLLADWARAWPAPGGAPASGAPAGLGPVAEALAVALGLLAPCLVALSLARPGWRRLVLVAGATALGYGALTLSTALNFGPQHALAWRTPAAEMGFAAGTAVAALLAWVPPRVAAGLGLVVIGAGTVLVSTAPADPYFAQSLQAWEQGRFVRLHGAAHWIGWLWPFAAIAFLLSRVGRPAA